MTWVLASVALSFLIVVHEGGHYVVARWCGMRIETFSLGFGPGLLKRKSKKTGTVFQLAPIPFGGYVEIRGMNIAEDVDPEDRFAYPNRPTWQRFATIFAGPATNYLSAVVLAFLLFSIHGHDVGHWYKVEVLSDDHSPAAGKLQPEDRILAVDHQPVFIDGTTTLQDRINASAGAPVTLTIERDGTSSDVVIQPKRYKDDKTSKESWIVGIGIKAEAQAHDMSIAESAKAAAVFPIDTTKAIVAGFYGIFTGTEKADPKGAVGIVTEFHKAFNAGLPTGVRLLMVLSVYLGLFNLFPLPALDGGRLVFLCYELITRRRANPKIEATVHMGGIMVLIVVMVFVTLRDVHIL